MLYFTVLYFTVLCCTVLWAERRVLHAALPVPVRGDDEYGLCVRLHHLPSPSHRRDLQETLHCNRSVEPVLNWAIVCSANLAGS